MILMFWWWIPASRVHPPLSLLGTLGHFSSSTPPSFLNYKLPVVEVTLASPMRAAEGTLSASPMRAGERGTVR